MLLKVSHRLKSKVHSAKVGEMISKTPTEAAAELGVHVDTLRRWRSKGCPFHEGLADSDGCSRPRYCVAEVRAWLKARASKRKEVQA